MNAKVRHFQRKLLGLLAVALLFWRAGDISLGVDTPSSSGNVYFANGQSDRILVPYERAMNSGHG
jgi:hypothetical protein